MRVISISRRSKWRTVVVALAICAPWLPAGAQTGNVTPENIAVFNLLSPFLSLNATPIGQQTLQVDLSQSVAINQNAASAALLNDNLSTPALAALAISDENLLGKASNTVTGASGTYGIAANLAGGLPTQNTSAWALYNGQQPVGGFGSVLGAAYVTGVSPSAVTLPNTVNLLVTANTQIVNNVASSDSQIAKFYFANGTINGTTAAVAPAGSTLPTYNGLPNKTNSVYDTAFGVSNTQSGQNGYGGSHPYQTAPADGYSFTLYDSTVKTASSAAGAPTPSTNPAFPSSHMAYSTTDSLLLGMMVPQLYQSMLLRASAMGESRIVVGVHYPTDIIASRAFASFDLANLLGNPSYISNAAVTGTSVNLPSMFASAAPELRGQLTSAAASASCGTSLASCATSSANANPYAASATNTAVYAARMTYGLPTLTYAQAPGEQAPAGSPDASILLATVYGGSTAQAQALASAVGGAMYGNLSTATINQIIVNTEANALAAFYGTSLSYWTRINLYAAAGYFQNVTGTIMLAPGDQLIQNVTVASTGVLGGSGAINGNVTFQSGSALGVQGNGTAASAPLTVSGTTALQAGSQVQLTGLFLPGVKYTLITGTSAISVDPSVTVVSTGSNLMALTTGTLAVSGDPTLTVQVNANFASAALTGNQTAVAAAIDTAANAGTYGANGTALLTSLITNNTAATAPAAFDTLSGEGITGQQQIALNAGEIFAATVLSQAMAAGDATPMGQRHAWATGFGQTAGLDSNTGSGSVSGVVTGFAAGGDYQVTPSLSVGIAAGYSTDSFAVSARSTTGTLQGGHVGLYGVDRFGPLYFAGTVDYAHFDNTENRNTFGLGERGMFGSNEWLVRGEAGYKLAVSTANVTPFGGFQVNSLANDSFSEGGAGSAVYGLTVDNHTVNSGKTFLGVQVDTRQAVGNLMLIPFARVAWEHEFSTGRDITASFQSLPGSGFTVYGAPAGANLARVDAGVNVNVLTNLALYAEFDGAFSGAGNAYAGRGGLRFIW
jgi:uncharacterized protein with beta-barrel porin domain